jgi:hypothetical protein
MSAWRIGSEQSRGPVFMAGKDIKSYIDRITKWIPGDVLAIYAAGVTVLASGVNAQPDIRWLLIMALATPVIVILSAWASGPLQLGHLAKAILALGAFAIWSITVPFSGWQRWDAIARDPGFTSIVAGLAGLVFGLIAEGVARRWIKA